MKKQSFKDLTVAELNERVAEEKANLTKLTLNHAVSAIENPLAIRYSRRNVARLLTEINKRNKSN